MSAPAEPVPLCVSEPATFWPWFTWAEFARMPEKDRTVVVVPLAGFADWGLGHALDAEEQVLTHVLTAAAGFRPADERQLVLPPLRFVAGPSPECAFAVDPPSALALVSDVCASVKAAGFRRIVLLNASPWNEELVDVAARDLRIDQGLQMFCVNLSALGLDFRPDRAASREELRTLLDALNAPDHPPGQRLEPRGEAILERCARHLASLLSEIAARPSLPRNGALNATLPP
jgi:creatinine amidohydrolase